MNRRKRSRAGRNKCLRQRSRLKRNVMICIRIEPLIVAAPTCVAHYGILRRNKLGRRVGRSIQSASLKHFTRLQQARIHLAVTAARARALSIKEEWPLLGLRQCGIQDQPPNRPPKG